MTPSLGRSKQACTVPYAIGFGISGPEQVRQMGRYAHGVIVGSAVVELVEQYGKDAPKPVGEFVAQSGPGRQRNRVKQNTRTWNG